MKAKNHPYTREEVKAAIRRGASLFYLSQVLGYRSVHSFLRWLGGPDGSGPVKAWCDFFQPKGC